MIAEQISVFLQNRKGHLADVTKVLADNKINIRAISIFDTPDYGILRLIVDRPEETVELLKSNGYTVSKSKVFAIDVKDHPGGLFDVISVFDNNDINIEYVYSFVIRKSGGPLILFKVDEPEKAIELMKTNNITVIPKEDLYD